MATGALQGLKVVDLTRVVAGPLCTQILADHGAEVVKIESPEGDETRRLGPPFDEHGDAAYFSGLNRNKRSIALDLGAPAGREVLLRLISGADVLIENFLPGTMKKWGFDYEADLAARFPRLIYCSVTGFGADGPMGGKPGYDAVAQALCGLMSVNGFPETGPARVGIPVVDLATGMNAAIAILLALAERTRSGCGQRAEVTLFDTALAMLHPHASNSFMGGAEPRLPGNAHPSISTYDTYQAADGRIFLGIVNDGQFRKFCALLGREDIPRDERFASNASRMANRPAMRQAIEAMLHGHTVSSLFERLMAAGIPARVVRSVPQALGDPHAAHRGMVVSRGAYRGINAAQTLSRTPASLRAIPPTFARDTHEILAASAGYNAADIEAFVVSGVAPLERRVDRAVIRTGTLEKAREGRRHLVLPNGAGYWRNGLITAPPGAAVSSPAQGALAPQAFLVEQDPGTTIEPHFHQENEFQVVVEGNGFLGRHAVEPVQVHYAGAHTGYGPVIAGSKGLSYFTLRARTDPGAQFLPGARDKMKKGPKRHLLARAWPPSSAAELAASSGCEARELWEPQPDGVGAWMLRGAPNHAAIMPCQAAASCYLLVIGGALIMNGECLPRFAAIFISNHETPALRASKEGLELLVLQFPGTQEERT